MGKTYRKDSENNRKLERQKRKRKARNNKQGYNRYNYDNPEGNESRSDDDAAQDGTYFEKFSKRGNRR